MLQKRAMSERAKDLVRRYMDADVEVPFALDNPKMGRLVNMLANGGISAALSGAGTAAINRRAAAFLPGAAIGGALGTIGGGLYSRDEELDDIERDIAMHEQRAAIQKRAFLEGYIQKEATRKSIASGIQKINPSKLPALGKKSSKPTSVMDGIFSKPSPKSPVDKIRKDNRIQNATQPIVKPALDPLTHKALRGPSKPGATTEKIIDLFNGPKASKAGTGSYKTKGLSKYTPEQWRAHWASKGMASDPVKAKKFLSMYDSGDIKGALALGAGTAAIGATAASL